MDRRTILAIVLSVLVMSVYFLITYVPEANRTKPTTTENPAETANPAVASQTTDNIAPQSADAAKPNGDKTAIKAAETDGYSFTPLPALDTASLENVTVTLETGVFTIQFTRYGAVPTSIKLNKIRENDNASVEIVLPNEEHIYPFELILNVDGHEEKLDQALFEYEPEIPLKDEESDGKEIGKRIVFYKDFSYKNGSEQSVFRIKKTFEFINDEYLFKIILSIDTNGESKHPVQSYTLSYGPQSGPQYESLANKSLEYRNFIYNVDGKKKDVTSKITEKNPRYYIKDNLDWLAIEGKYFLVIGIPYNYNNPSFGFDSAPLSGIDKTTTMFFSREIHNGEPESYKFYIGPKKHDILAMYNDKNKNVTEEQGRRLDVALPGNIFGWLSDILKMILIFIYNLTKNYGVAIILLTLFIKVVLFPLTHKSFEATKKMQAINPKIEELKEKYKSNPQKLNQEMGLLYKKEGVNPLSGCLPMLLQIPIFFAMYYLTNNYFELRGAAFITGWINDLSSPEAVGSLPIAIPFLDIGGITYIRILPFFMVAMTFLQQMVSQNPGAQSNAQMKIFMYGMPLFFFFIMYNMPAGLLIYWSMQSLITFGQQYYTNNIKDKLKLRRAKQTP